jgi:uncharacterized protein YxjI
VQFPLELKFRILALASEASVTDTGGNEVMYIKQKAFRLKEDIRIFADSSQLQPLYTIRADRVIDFNANYQFTDTGGNVVGRIRRQGMKSLWKASYEIFDADTLEFTITEVNPWIKVADHLLAEVPVLGMFTGYVFNPSYNVSLPNGTVALTLTKAPSFTGRFFRIEKHVELPESLQRLALLGLFMFDVLERGRG